MTKIPPSQRIQQQIEQLWLQGSDGTASILSTVLRLGTQRVVQELLEHEVTAFLGRDHYRRGPRRITGYRNGYKPKTLPTVAGRIPVQVPQVRETPEPFPSRLLRFLAAPAQQDVLTDLVFVRDGDLYTLMDLGFPAEQIFHMVRILPWSRS